MKKYIAFVVIIGVYLLDLITKLIVSSNMKLYSSITVIKNFFSITYTKNVGAAFSMFSNKPWLIIIVSILVFIYLMYELLKKDNSKFSSVSIALIIGGLISNLSDRLFLGYVRDFLDFQIFNYDFAIFNVGDIAIVVGCFLFVIAELLESKNGNKSK